MSEKNLYQRINQVMNEVEGVEKSLTIEITSTRKYSAVSHDEVTKILHKPITKAGIVIQTSVTSSSIEIFEKEKLQNGIKSVSREYMASVTVELTAINMDQPSERLSVSMPAIAFDSGDKAHGKAISMATKIALLKLFMLESYDEEEKRPETGKTIMENKKTNTPKTPPKDNQSADGDYVARVGKFKGNRLADIHPKELADYCKYMKSQNPNLDGPMKEFIDKSREFLTGAV